MPQHYNKKSVQYIFPCPHSRVAFCSHDPECRALGVICCRGLSEHGPDRYGAITAHATHQPHAETSLGSVHVVNSIHVESPLIRTILPWAAFPASPCWTNFSQACHGEDSTFRSFSRCSPVSNAGSAQHQPITELGPYAHALIRTTPTVHHAFTAGGVA